MATNEAIPRTLRVLLIANTVIELAAGAVVIFAPGILVPQTAINREIIMDGGELWRGGQAVTSFGRSIFGCAAWAFAVSSLVTLLRPWEKPSSAVLATLAFYHTSVLGPVLSDFGFNTFGAQIPSLMGHGSLALGFSYFALNNDD